MTDLTDAQRTMAEAMTEKELSDAVYDLALTLGWKVYRASDRAVGYAAAHGRWDAMPDDFIDMILVYRHDDYARLIFAELKDMRGKLTPGQIDWIRSLSHTSNLVELWRPSDWVSGRIEKLLRGDWVGPTKHKELEEILWT